jgi:hypothetical protein
LTGGEPTGVSGSYLEEVGEATAAGEVAAIYEEIRTTTGVPFVSLLYRHLAVEPDVLERAWAAVAPVLCSPDGRSAAAELARVESPDVVALPASALAVVGVDAGEFDAINATLDAYVRANSGNLLASHILLGRPRSTRVKQLWPSAPSDRRPVAESGILPMHDLRDLEAPTVALLEEIGVYLGGGAGPLIVPSLWRHFGHRPPLIALLWTSMRPSVLDGSVDRHVDALVRRADLVAREFARSETSDGRTADRVRPFLATIPRMLVCVAMMRSALREGAQLRAGAT